MPDFGKRVKALRQTKKISKETLCGDETELSVRQLSRIESGQSTPSLAKVEFIAQQLGVRVGQLTDPETFQLPERYQELKHLLLRTQTYMEPSHIRQCEAYLDTIFEDYYDKLPEEEQMIIEVLRSRIDYALDTENTMAIHLLDDYLNQVKQKKNYNINDLILLNTYFIYLAQQSAENSTAKHPATFNQHQQEEVENIITRLLQTSSDFPSSQLFIFINTISAAASNCLTRKDFSNLTLLLNRMEQSMKEAQDFQRMPIYHLLMWKYQLLTENHAQAQKHYDNACLFAQLTQNDYLCQRLISEWEKDCSTVSK